jgi:hypothetical protein
MNNVPGPAVTIADLQKQLDDYKMKNAELLAQISTRDAALVNMRPASDVRAGDLEKGALAASAVGNDVAGVDPGAAVSTATETDGIAALALRVGELEKKVFSLDFGSVSGDFAELSRLIDHLYQTFGQRKPAPDA